MARISLRCSIGTTGAASRAPGPLLTAPNSRRGSARAAPPIPFFCRAVRRASPEVPAPHPGRRASRLRRRPGRRPRPRGGEALLFWSTLSTSTNDCQGRNYPAEKRWVPASVGTNRPRAGASTGGRAHVGRFHHSQACDILGLRRRPGMRRALAGETVGEVHIPGRGVAGHRPRRDVCPAGVPRRRMPRHVLSIAARPVTVPLGRRAAAGARPPLPGLAAVGLPRRRSGARVLWDLKRNWSTPRPRRSQRSAGRVAAKIRRAVIIRYVVAFVSWTRPDWILTVWTALLRGAAGAAGIPSRTSQTHAVILNDA